MTFPSAMPATPAAHLPTEDFTDAAGQRHTLVFTRPDSLVALRSIMPKLGFLLKEGEQNEGGSVLRLLGAVAMPDGEADVAATLERMMERLAEEVLESGDEELTVALLAHVSMDQKHITKAVIQTTPVEDIRSLVLLVLRRDYAPFFSRRIERTSVTERPLLEAARAWLQKNGLDAVLSLALRRFSTTAFGSPTDESPSVS